jgi:hypothetical protein
MDMSEARCKNTVSTAVGDEIRVGRHWFSSTGECSLWTLATQQYPRSPVGQNHANYLLDLTLDPAWTHSRLSGAAPCASQIGGDV